MASGFGQQVQSFASSYYIGELDGLVCECKCTKVFQGILLVVVRMDNQAIVDKWKLGSLYDNDIRIF